MTLQQPLNLVHTYLIDLHSTKYISRCIHPHREHTTHVLHTQIHKQHVWYTNPLNTHPRTHTRMHAHTATLKILHEISKMEKIAMISKDYHNIRRLLLATKMEDIDCQRKYHGQQVDPVNCHPYYPHIDTHMHTLHDIQHDWQHHFLQ